jgi:hypothetical protein
VQISKAILKPFAYDIFLGFLFNFFDLGIRLSLSILIEKLILKFAYREFDEAR